MTDIPCTRSSPGQSLSQKNLFGDHNGSQGIFRDTDTECTGSVKSRTEVLQTGPRAGVLLEKVVSLVRL